MKQIRLEAVTTSFFGYGCLSNLTEELIKRQAKRALIVTDSFLYEAGVANQVGGVLLLAGMEYAIYYQVQPNPTIEVVNECIEAAKSLEVDWLVAVGGGSAIDTAKAVSIVLANGGSVADYEGTNRSRVPGLPIVAVNTTAGTGSEVTTFYIVTDHKRHTKMCMVDPNCKVRIAVNDTALMCSMPKGLTAATGMDAMTHAIEAVLSKRANPLTDKDALWAIRTIKKYLPRAVEDGMDLLAREQMAYAQYVAGMAFSNAGLGMVHAMAHSLGGHYNLPHGICNALLLPHVMRFNGRDKNSEGNFKKIAQALELSSSFDDKMEVVGRSIQAIEALAKEVGITKGLKELQVNSKDFEGLARLALKDACMLDNPVMPTIEQVIFVYQEAY
ncbi:MAG: alcohol dehydrogenase, partial [Clostridiales bacterium]|nr:alcohol dehydrogenase [Clostridiales bacterium]